MSHSKPINPIVATTTYYLAFILLGLTTAVTGPTLPALANNTSSRIDQISAIFIAGSLGYLIGSWFGGRAYDRLPSNRLIPSALIVLTLGVVYIPISSELSLLVLVIFILGISQGVLDVGGNTLLLWIHGPRVGPYMNGLHFFFGVGALLSPIAVAQIVSISGDIQWVYWLFGLVALPLAVWTWFLPNPPPREKHSSENRSPVNITLLLLFMVFFFLYVGAEIGYGNWIFTYTTTLQLGTPMAAAYLTSAFWGFFTLSRLAGIPISIRVAPNKILFADLIGCLISLGLLIVGANSTQILWIGTIILGISMASIFPTLMTLADSKLHNSGEITGWLLIGTGLGGMFLPWIIGQAFTTVGPQSVMRIIFIDMLANLFILIVLVGRSAHFGKRKATTETSEILS
jgi:MFS transporter, FHS family, Na+ dependent glucose transporter 1